MADVTYIPDSNSQMNGYLPWMLAGQNNGGLFGGNGWGGGILGFFLGLLFGNGWGGFGNGFGGWGGGNSGAGFLSNQISNDAGRELLMNAITSQGEAGRAATQNLATALGQDFNLVNGAIQTLQSSLSTLALQQAVSRIAPVYASAAVFQLYLYRGGAEVTHPVRGVFLGQRVQGIVKPCLLLIGIAAEPAVCRTDPAAHVRSGFQAVPYVQQYARLIRLHLVFCMDCFQGKQSFLFVNPNAHWILFPGFISQAF